MNIYHKVLPLSALTLLMIPGAAFCREAQMLDFSVDTQQTSANDALSSYQGPPEAGAGYEVQTSEPATNVLPRVDVPAWMKRPAASVTAVTLPSITANSLSNCEPSSYKPIGRLSIEAEQRRSRYYPLVMAIACEAGVPGHLFDALVAQESRYNPAAISPKGAGGLTQLMPDTATRLGVSNRFDVLQNLRGGARYLRTQLDEFGRYDLALGAYNAGPGRVRQYKSLPPFRETLLYVKTILSDVRAAVLSSTDKGFTSRPARIRTASFMGF